MVTAEPSAGNIWNAARSAVSLKVTVHDREAHVGQAAFGVNSFEQMVQIATPLRDYVKDLANRHTGFNMDGNDHRGSMVVVGGLSGGGCNFNVVPGESWFTIDARLNPEEDAEVTRKEITSIIENGADAIGADVSVEVTQFSRPPVLTNVTQLASPWLAASPKSKTPQPPSRCAQESSTSAGTRSSEYPHSHTAPDVLTARTNHMNTSMN